MLSVREMFDEVMDVICNNIKNDDFFLDTSIGIVLTKTVMKLTVSDAISLEGLDVSDLDIKLMYRKTVIIYTV